MVISGDDVCCSVVFGTLVGVFSVMWSSVYECQRVECEFTSPVRTDCGMSVIYYMQCCVSVICFVVRGCAVSWSWRYINVCNCDMFSVVNVYLDHLKNVLCVLMVEGMSAVVNVVLSLMSIMSPPAALRNLSARTVVKLCTLGVFSLRMSLVS